MLNIRKNYLGLFLIIFVLVTIFSFSFFTEVSFAQLDMGIVSTENIGCSGPDCQFCNLMKGVNNLLSFLVYFASIAAVGMFVWAGVKLIFAQGSAGELQKAKDIFWNVVVGFIITIAAFLIIDFLLKSLLSTEENSFGTWNEIECVAIPPTYSEGGYTGGPGTGGESDLTDAEVRAAFTSNRITSTANLAGVHSEVIDELNRLTDECDECLVIITSARTGNHTCNSTFSHCNGWKVDLSLSNSTLNSYIQSNGVFIGRRSSDNAPMWQIGNATYAKESNHWDVVVKP